MNVFATAGMCLQRVLEKNASIKESVLGDDRIKAKGAVYALVCETLKRYHGILYLMRRSGLLRECSSLGQPPSEFLLAVLTYEVLFGKNSSVKRAGMPGKLVLSWRSRLDGIAKRDFPGNEGLVAPAVQQAMELQAQWPRHLRVNTLMSGAYEAVRQAISEGVLDSASGDQSVLDVFTCSPAPIRKARRGSRGADPHDSEFKVKPIIAAQKIALPADLRDFPLLQERFMVQQDRSSCMPALALLASPSPAAASSYSSLPSSSSVASSPSSPGRLSALPWPPVGPYTVVDACAAPGNKTIQLAALLTRSHDESFRAGLLGAVSKDSAGAASSARTPRAPAGPLSLAARTRWEATEAALPAFPGNKVLAFDRDRRRAGLLRRRCDEYGASGIVRSTLGSFLDLRVDAGGTVTSMLPGVPAEEEDEDYEGSNKHHGEVAPGIVPKEEDKGAVKVEEEVEIVLPPVRAVLLDPSCSGSGMVQRLERALELAVGEAQRDRVAAKQNQSHKQKKASSSSSDAEGVKHSTGASAAPSTAGAGGILELPATTVEERRRLQALSQFQMQALEHALMLPSVQRVVYSTCSVHVQEDEGVVVAALARVNARIAGLRRRQQQDEGNLAGTLPLAPWRLIPALPWWKRRGVSAPGLSETERQFLVRVDAKLDLSGGFFVALFERCPPDQVASSEVDDVNLHAVAPAVLGSKRGRGSEEANRSSTTSGSESQASAQAGAGTTKPKSRRSNKTKKLRFVK